MNSPEIFAIIGSVFTVIAALGGFIFYVFQRLEADIGKIDSRLEGWMKHSIAIQAEQSKRTDKLYEMFRETDQKFYDLLKEQKKQS